MVADILSQAVDDINQCVKENPRAYRAYLSEIEAVTTAMTALRMVFDAAPSADQGFNHFVQSVRRTLYSINYREMKHRIDALLNYCQARARERDATDGGGNP